MKEGFFLKCCLLYKIMPTHKPCLKFFFKISIFLNLSFKRRWFLSQNDQGVERTLKIGVFPNMISLNNWINITLNPNPRPAPRGGTAGHGQERRNFPTGKSAPNPKFTPHSGAAEGGGIPKPLLLLGSILPRHLPKFTFPSLEKIHLVANPSRNEGPSANESN